MGIKQNKLKEENPLKGNLVFYQNCLPPLGAGDYTLNVEQTISSGTDGKIKDTTYQNTKHFAVTGPRFTMDPSLISSVYPPQDASGKYSNVLPHICFTRDTLPWERSAETREGLTETLDVPPWLGVLIIAQDDPKTEIKQITLLDLLDAKYQTSSGQRGKLPDHFLYPGFPGKAHNELEHWEKWDDPCVVIDIPIELFNSIAPTYNDLRWLGHVREVQAGPQSAAYLTKLKSMSDESTPPRFSTVISNRFPAEGSKSLAALVSFENFAKYLPGNDGTPSPLVSEGTTHVRMILFKQWNFYAVSEDQTFSGYLLSLNKNDPPKMKGFLQLATNDSNTEPDDKAINNAFNMGYVPLNHHTRQGDKTVSWYRGPFLPFDEKASIDIPVDGPDSCTAYNQDTGMFDVSYAAAYQLGRLLALQNNNFAETLYNWKRENLQTVIAAFEEDVIRRSLKEIIERQGDTDNADRQSIDRLLISSLGSVLKKFINQTNLGHAIETE